jgi:3'(2'), 5'-bisphosphate nucleotidase
MSRYDKEVAEASAAAARAGQIIRGYYDGGGAKSWTKGDNSPVTRADLEADAAISAHLRRVFPDDALVTEESQDQGDRLGAARLWIVDPLDGTRDFISRSGDFSVHVGLAVNGAATVGVVYRPLGDLLYTAVRGQGAFVHQPGRAARRLQAAGPTGGLACLRLGITRYAASEPLRRFLAATGLGERAVPMGASVKMLAVAEGELDAAVWLSKSENDWDTCAPEVIVAEAGGAFTDLDGQPFVYNRPTVRHERGIVVSSGHHHAELAAAARGFLP